MEQSKHTILSLQALFTALRHFSQGNTRFAFAWTFFVLLGFFARDFPQWPGMIVCFIGATLRVWASGFLRKNDRPAIGGPYSFVRNPLYLGTYIMSVGICIAVEAWLLCSVTTVLFAVVHYFIILHEEENLAGILGEPYILYCRLVPRLFPRFFPAPTNDLLEVNPDPAHLKYDWSLGWKQNKAYEAYLTLLGFWTYTVICAWVWQRYFQEYLS